MEVSVIFFGFVFRVLAQVVLNLQELCQLRFGLGYRREKSGILQVWVNMIQGV